MRYQEKPITSCSNLALDHDCGCDLVCVKDKHKACPDDEDCCRWLEEKRLPVDVHFKLYTH